MAGRPLSLPRGSCMACTSSVALRTCLVLPLVSFFLQQSTYQLLEMASSCPPTQLSSFFCHNSGLPHGTWGHVLGNMSYLGRVRPRLWSQAELSWAGTKWQNFIHSDMQKYRPLFSMTHLILLLRLYSHRCLGKEWGRSFNSSIKDSSAFSSLKQSLSG